METLVEQNKMHGFFRVVIDEDGKIVGDSGRVPNNVTNDGMDQYILQLMSTGGASKRVTHVALGTGTAPADGDNTLAGESTQGVSARAVATLVTSASSRLRITATFFSQSSFVTANFNISNIGLFQQSNTNTATLFAGQAYVSSTVATNQNVNITYDLNFTG